MKENLYGGIFIMEGTRKIIMNKEYVDEINMLLKDHSLALTAFYDEGINEGLRAGWRARRNYDIGCISGVGTVVGVVGGVIIMSVYKIKKHKIKKKQKTES